MKSLVLPTVLFAVLVTICALSIDPDVPWDCPANEEYYKCAPAKCFATCADLKNNKPCPALLPECYEPACLCKGQTYKNDAGECVPFSECD